MSRTSDNKQRSAFSRWLRTGKLPPAESPDGLETKFNPWHDPDDGRFTFAGSGRYFGAGGAGSAVRAKPHKLRVALERETRAADSDTKPEGRGFVRVRSVFVPKFRLGRKPNAVADFLGGVGDGLRDVAKETASGVYSALTTNPVTTVRNVERGIADTIDAAIAAEDTPARVQASRAIDSIASSSVGDVGHAAGSAIGNVAVAAAPGAVLSKVAAARRLRIVSPRPVYDPPQVNWMTENLGPEKPWTAYNNSATGSRPGQAPALMRTMPDGSKRPVKFDGIQGDYVIDRKFGVSARPRARDQILRQSEVLLQNRLIGVWEVPTTAHKIKADKLLKSMNVTNIKVRVVKP